MFVHPITESPAIIKLGPIFVPYYGVGFAMSILLFDYLGHYRAKQLNYLTEEALRTLWLYLLIGVIVGARVGDIIFYRLHYIINYAELFRASYLLQYNAWISLGITILSHAYAKWVLPQPLPYSLFIIPILLIVTGDAGMSFHGALIGVTLGVLIYSYHFKQRFLRIMDFIAPLTPPGLGVGRLANFLNSELWGRPTQMPWGVIFPSVDWQPRHPSQLYECLLEGPLLFLILWLFSKRSQAEGIVFGLSMTLYAIIRILVEFVREPDVTIGFVAWNWLTMGQLLSIPMLLIGIFLLAKNNQTSLTRVLRRYHK